MAVVSVVLGLLCVCVTPCLTAPAKTFDQRQQGDLNIHAQLDNIVVVVIPSARLNLLDLALDSKWTGEKGGFLQMLQKLQNVNIDRYETVKVEEEPQEDSSTGELQIDIRKPIPVVTSSQQVSLNHEAENGDREEEVVATVEEMRPDPVNKITQTPKLEAMEDSILKEQSSISEVNHDSVPAVNRPGEENQNARDTEKKTKDSSKSENDNKETTQQSVLQDVNVKVVSNKIDKITTEKLEPLEKQTLEPPKTEKLKTKPISKEPPKEEKSTIEDYIKPVAAKEEITPASSALKKTQSLEDQPPKKSNEPVRLQEGVRKEKVIRYKPEAKWAPELVDLLGPPRPKPKDIQERHMFADLCSPGVWDPELRTCIMPGETRSRSELGRFLSAMRFGIAVPK